jgi:hypothetical protein
VLFDAAKPAAGLLMVAWSCGGCEPAASTQLCRHPAGQAAQHVYSRSAGVVADVLAAGSSQSMWRTANIVTCTIQPQYQHRPLEQCPAPHSKLTLLNAQALNERSLATLMMATSGMPILSRGAHKRACSCGWCGAAPLGAVAGVGSRAGQQLAQVLDGVVAPRGR